MFLSMKVIPEGSIYHKYITSFKTRSYEFVLYYAEILSEAIAEFPHHHPLYQILYVLEGTIQIGFADTVVSLPRGSCIILAKDIKHHIFYNPSRKKKYFSMIFDFITFKSKGVTGPDGELEWTDINAMLQQISKKGYIVSSGQFSDKQLLDQILWEQKYRETGWNTCLCTAFFRFFIEVLRQIEGKQKTRDLVPAGKLNLAMEATKYIHKHYQEAISLESIAQYLNISPRHVNRTYQAMFGTTFMKNLSRLRIEYAKIYLFETELSIETIAEMVGFTSSRVLYKLFKKYEGISLSQYRAKFAKKRRKQA
jgi:AraC-like DNA-binding protein